MQSVSTHSSMRERIFSSGKGRQRPAWVSLMLLHIWPPENFSAPLQSPHATQQVAISQANKAGLPSPCPPWAPLGTAKLDAKELRSC